jgi:5'-deoxynucleotidase YfbR-like HD superfamily hydrolase
MQSSTGKIAGAADMARPLPLTVERGAGAGSTAGARRRLGVAVVGLGGAVATTAVAGIALPRAGIVGTTGLPLAGLPADLTAGLARYEDLVFGGWDLGPADLATAARAHRVDSFDSKLGTKGSVLDGILGYPVEDHVVTIEYYRPRGANNEAWDTIDSVGVAPADAAVRRAPVRAPAAPVPALAAGRRMTQGPGVPGADAGDGAALRALLPLAREFNTLKRVRAAGRPGSWAERAFARAWGRVAQGHPPAEVARWELVAAITATVLGAVDAEFFAAERASPVLAYRAMRTGWQAATAPLPPEARHLLAATVGEGAGALTTHLAQAAAAAHEAPLPVPSWVARLAEQPRAGPTRPGTPRLMLVPAESHAEHCWAVAVTGALLAPAYGADAATVFLAGLAHHLPNAWLPDAGDAADVALAGALDAMHPALRDRALCELAAGPRVAVEAALAAATAGESGDARAFHAADALDRVLEMEWFARVAAFTLDDALGERPGAFNILHPGPNQEAERAALGAAGLLAGGGA